MFQSWQWSDIKMAQKEKAYVTMIVGCLLLESASVLGLSRCHKIEEIMDKM